MFMSIIRQCKKPRNFLKNSSIPFLLTWIQVKGELLNSKIIFAVINGLNAEKMNGILFFSKKSISSH